MSLNIDSIRKKYFLIKLEESILKKLHLSLNIQCFYRILSLTKYLIFILK